LSKIFREPMKYGNKNRQKHTVGTCSLIDGENTNTRGREEHFPLGLRQA
jgi:hypothetical protein